MRLRDGFQWSEELRAQRPWHPHDFDWRQLGIVRSSRCNLRINSRRSVRHLGPGCSPSRIQSLPAPPYPRTPSRSGSELHQWHRIPVVTGIQSLRQCQGNTGSARWRRRRRCGPERCERKKRETIRAQSTGISMTQAMHAHLECLLRQEKVVLHLAATS